MTKGFFDGFGGGFFGARSGRVTLYGSTSKCIRLVFLTLITACCTRCSEGPDARTAGSTDAADRGGNTATAYFAALAPSEKVQLRSLILGLNLSQVFASAATIKTPHAKDVWRALDVRFGTVAGFLTGLDHVPHPAPYSALGLGGRSPGQVFASDPERRYRLPSEMTDAECDEWIEKMQRGRYVGTVKRIVGAFQERARARVQANNYFASRVSRNLGSQWGGIKRLLVANQDPFWTEASTAYFQEHCMDRVPLPNRDQDPGADPEPDAGGGGAQGPADGRDTNSDDEALCPANPHAYTQGANAILLGAMICNQAWMMGKAP